MTSTSSPAFATLDFETSLNGVGSTEFWHPQFRVDSMAVSYPGGDSEYHEGEDECKRVLHRLADTNVPLVAHNVQFELGVTRCRFPAVASKLRWLADTMRLVQVYDNGGEGAFALPLATLDDELDAALAGEDIEAESIAGLGLVVAARRILKEEDHKAEAHAYIRFQGIARGQEGAHLTLLPPDIARRYNVGDTEVTMRLYQFLTDHFAKRSYDWHLDHGLYFSSVHRIVAAKIRGVAVDRKALAIYRTEVQAEIARLGEAFTHRFADEIRAVERERLVARLRKLKTLRGRCKFVRRYRRGSPSALKDVRFNVGSNQQLAQIFIGQLGMEAKFVTDKGAPSFRSAVLSQWGDGGELLKTRRKRQLVLNQATSLLALSATDGRWHMDLRACGTATGRYSGGQHA